jgi:uncharacterized membrane protein
MIANALTGHYVFSVEKVWLDLIWVGLLAIIHAAANWKSPNLGTTTAECDRAFGLVKELAASSLTVAGILLPLSLTAVATFASKHAEPRVLTNIFVGDAWLALSLAMGLLVLWAAGFRAFTTNVQNSRWIRLLNGWQLLAILAGVVRLLIATFFLVQTST